MTAWSPEDHWPETVTILFEEITNEHDLSSVEGARLYLACDMLTHATALDEVVRESGPMASGSTGNDIVSPAIVESRQLRTAAAAIIGTLGTSGRGGKTTSTSARMAARKRWGAPGVAS